MLGTAHAQYHLRQCFMFLNMRALTRPEVMIADADEKFDECGNLTDTDSRNRIQKLLQALVAWTRQLQR